MSGLWVCGGGGIGDAIESEATARGMTTFVSTHEEVDVRSPLEIGRYIRNNGPFDHVAFTAGINRLQWITDIISNFDMVDTMQTNVVGFANVMSCLARMQDGGRVVAVSSDAADRPMRGSLAYCASKAALDMAVRVAARELAGMGWRVNAVSPGMTEPTGMQRQLDDEIYRFRGWSRKYAEEYEQAGMVIKRRATTQEVAQVVLDVLSGPDYLNGSIVTINGGR